MTTPPRQPLTRVAIACGGTGGHLFPGLAVASVLRERGCAVTLLVSNKEVDREALKSAGLEGALEELSESRGALEVISLPAIGLTRGRVFGFMRGFARSYFAARRAFQHTPPQAALAMGGFTAAPPLLAAKRLGARIFLHESNTIPGRANRWLSRLVDQAFVGFPAAAGRLHTRSVLVTGTPVRTEFGRLDANGCRAALGLSSSRPVVLVTGGSQGATGLNQLVLGALPLLAQPAREWQWFHLTGAADLEKVKAAYATGGCDAKVHSFFGRMDLALGAASVAVSRAGASSLAELAAARLPAILVPYPAATDNHQWHNARALSESGAAQMLEQKAATPRHMADALLQMVQGVSRQAEMKSALAKWHAPHAAEQIADSIVSALAPIAQRQKNLDKPQAGTNRTHTCLAQGLRGGVPSGQLEGPIP